MSIAVYTVCKSNVNHWQLRIPFFHTYPVAMYIYIYLHLHEAIVNLSQIHLTQPRVNVLRHVSVNTKIICKVTLSLGLLSPPNPYFRGIHKVRKFLLNLGMKYWKSAFNAQGSRLIIVALRSRSSENICSNNEGAKEKGKAAWNSVHHKNWGPPTLK